MKRSSKILVYGVLFSILFIISCIYTKKLSDKDVVEQVVEKNVTVVAKKQERKEIVKKKTSTISYRIDRGMVYIGGKIAELKKDDPFRKELFAMCGVAQCNMMVIFSSDYDDPHWKGFAKGVIEIFNNDGLQYADFSVNQNSEFHIRGTFIKESSKKDLDNLVQMYHNYHIKNRTKVKMTGIKEVEEKNTTTNIVSVEKRVENKKVKDNIEVAQNEIKEILKKEKITFFRNRAKITTKSVETLNKIIAILKRIPDVEIEVRGYTDASGKKDINKWISVERAKSVKRYISNFGINPNNIEAKGFGEEGLLYEDKPYSELNRRVEIVIKKRR